jgi:hypothetical protein
MLKVWAHNWNNQIWQFDNWKNATNIGIVINQFASKTRIKELSFELKN